MRRNWKAAVSWLLIIAMLGGYGNTALAAGAGSAPQSTEEQLLQEKEQAAEESGADETEETTGKDGQEDETPAEDGEAVEQPEAGDVEEGAQSELSDLPETGEIEARDPFDVFLHEEGAEDLPALYGYERYEDSFGGQIEDTTAKELYDLMREKYVTKREKGELTATLDNPIVVTGASYSEAKSAAENEITERFYTAYAAFMMDSPSAFWIRSNRIMYYFSYTMNGDAYQCAIRKVTIQTVEEYYDGASSQITAFDQAVAQAKAEIRAKAGEKADAYELVTAIHDYLCDKLVYDTPAGNALGNDAYNYAHTASTVFLGHDGEYKVVCEGYAKAFKILCDEFDIPCALVIGTGISGGSSGAHMWNYVQMDDDQWYGMDVTWDDSLAGKDYFLSGSETPGSWYNSTFSSEHVEGKTILSGVASPFSYPVLKKTAYVHEDPYRGTLENGTLRISDTDAGRQLSAKRILTILKGHAGEALDAVELTLTDTYGALDKQISAEILNAAAAALTKNGVLKLEFAVGETQEMTRWELTGLRKASASFDGAVTGKEEGQNWALTLAASEIPAESVKLSWSVPALANAYTGADTPIYYYYVNYSGERKYMESAGSYRYEAAADRYLLEADQVETWQADRSYIATTEKMAYGWQENENGQMVYRDSRSGELLKGWQTLDGQTCWFDADGVLAEGAAQADGKWYLFGFYEDGTQGLLTGYQTIKTGTYSADKNGVLQTGWQNWRYFSEEEETYGQELPVSYEGNYWYRAGDKRYYFKDNKTLLKGWQKIGGRWYYFDQTTGAEDSTALPKETYWAEAAGELYYFKNGTGLAKGWQTIGGRRYYFDANGVLQTGFFTVGKDSYYGAEKTTAYPGAVVSGMQTIDGAEYYFNAKGVLQIGFQKINGSWSYFSTAADSPKRGQKQKLTVRRNGDFYWYNADGETYCLKKDTTLLKGWQTINSQKYYFDAKTGELQTGDGDGLYVLNGKTYYLGADGALRSGVIYGNAGQVYTADKNGVLQSGWQKLDGVWCYFDKQTKAQDPDAYMADDYFAYAVENGVSNTYYFTKGTKLATGWQAIDGARYYFAKDGVMQRGKTQIGSAWYYFEADGEMGTGFRKIGGFTYYFDANGKMATGSQKIDGETYYFNKQGVLMPEKLEGWQTEDGKAYFYKNGEPVTGWQTLTVNGVKGKYYFDKESGVAWTGARQLSGKWYYFIPEQQGRMASNETITDGDGTRRYYAADGTRQTGWKKIDGSWRYFLADGSECQVTVGSDGWATVQLSDTETMQVYIRKNSAVLTGWQTIDKQRYYFEPGSGAIYTGHRQIGTSWYYFDETTGQMQTGYCADADGVHYYYNAKGVAQTGFQKITKTGDWKFFDPESAIPGAEKAVQRSEQQDGKTLYVWYHVDGDRYCMKNDTTLLKGRQKLAGQTYWFHQTTGKLYTGFFAIGQDRYLSHEDGTVYTGLGPASKASTENDAYYDANGKMMTGWITIKDGEHPGKYYFNKLTGTSYRGGCYLVDGKEYLFDAYGCVKTDPVLESVKSNNYRTAEAKWKEEPAAVSYVLQWSKDKTFTEEELIHEQTYESSVLSAVATNLEVGSTYYFRVKYQLTGKNGALIDSNWSAVKSVKIMGGVAPTYTSAEIEGLDVTGVTSADGTVETQLHLDFAVNGWLQSYDETYYLVRVDSYADSILSSTDSPLYSIPMEMGTAGENGYAYSVDLTVPDEYAAENENVGDYFSRLVKTSEVVMGKYALAIKTDEDQYQRVSKGTYVSDPAQVAENHTGYYVPASKKGIQDAGSVYRGDMGTKHTLQNMRLGNLLKEEAGWDTLTWNYKGKEYYFDQDTINAMAGTVSEYNNEGISVSLVLLLDFPKDSAFQYLVRIGAQKKGAAPYYMMETTTQKAQETWEAIFSYLGFRFGQDSCFVSNWILGNEVNSCNAWNYKGGVSYNEYVKGYASAFRMLYYGVKMNRPSSRVFISLDNAWCKAVAGFAGKKVLDSFAADIAAENPNIEWNVAFHAYSAPLTRVGFWTDYSNTTNSVNSPFISMRNLDQLTNYLGSVESKYGKDSGSIRVILSEQGWTSSSSAGEHGQGEALARAYYIAEFNDRVDAFIIRAEVDAKEEVRNGLSMGMRYQNDTKKMAYYVYKYMDTPVVSNPNADSPQKALKDYDASKLWFSSEAHREKFAKAQQLLVEERDWSSIIPGYDAAKLNRMPYAAAE